jgi:hypothetical protein
MRCYIINCLAALYLVQIERDRKEKTLDTGNENRE